MQTKSNEDKLSDAMVLLEVADKMYPVANQFFSKYSTSDLIGAAHDLVQNVHSNGESRLEAATHELLATLEAARKYIDCNGHLWKPSPDSQEKAELHASKSGLFSRALTRIHAAIRQA